MASPKRQRKRLNKAAGRPVRIVVCAYPARSIESVTGLLKSALLYGDEVLLHSPLASMLGSVAAVAESDPSALIDLALDAGRVLDPQFRAQLERIDTEHGPGTAKRLLRELGNPRSFTRSVLGKQLEDGGLDLDAVEARLAGAQQEFGSVADEQMTAAGFDELSGAFKAGLLVIEPVDIDDDLTGYQRQLERLLNTPGHYAVFDDKLGDLVASMIDAGTIQASPHAMRRGTQAATADRLLGFLPTFPLATMDEIVDIRDVLRRPLVNFRAEMIKVTAELELNALAADFDDAATELWHARVRPALDQLHGIVRSNNLIRTYGAEAMRNLTVPTATALVVGLNTGSWTLASIGGMANLGVAAGARAADTRRRSKAEQRHNPYYFLHTTERQLG